MTIQGNQLGTKPEHTTYDQRPLKEVVFTPEFLQDPYPAYARLRREAPVWWCEAQSAWLVSRYSDVRAVLLDAQTYSNKPHAGLYGPYTDPNAGSFFLKDDPDHTAWRRIFTSGGGFTAARMKAMREMMVEIFTDVVDKLPVGRFDAVSDLSVPLNAKFFARVFNLPQEDAPWIKAIPIFYHPGTGDMAAELLAYFGELVKQRRAEPGHDPLSQAVLANASKGTLLNDSQMAWNFHDLVMAGAASMFVAIAEAVAVLAEHPEAQDMRYWDTPEAAARSTEEILRWHDNSHWLFRTATRDAELGGQMIRSGQSVFPILASANRDEAVWGNGGVLDLARTSDLPNLAFGYGSHQAVGAMMGRACLATFIPIILRARAPLSLEGEPQRTLGYGVSVPVVIPIAS